MGRAFLKGVAARRQVRRRRVPFYDAQANPTGMQRTASITRPDLHSTRGAGARSLSSPRDEKNPSGALTFISSTTATGLEITQIEHLLLQTSEAMRADGHSPGSSTPVIHDLGKVLCLYGEPNEVVTDTFPVGCAYSRRRLPRILRQQPRPAPPRLLDEIPSITTMLFCGTSTREYTCPSATTVIYEVMKNTCRRSALPAALPLLLPSPQARRLRLSNERPRPRNVQVGPRIQQVRPLLREGHQTGGTSSKP